MESPELSSESLMPLEAKLYEKPYDFNGLKGFVKSFMENNVLYDLSRGEAPNWVLSENPLDNDMDAVLRSGDSRNASLNEDEQIWLESLRELRNNLSLFKKSFTKDYYVSLTENRRTKETWNYGVLFAELLKPIISGYVDPSNENCPLCPSAKAGVTMRSWQEHIDPRRYLHVCHDMIFPHIGPYGLGISPDLLKD